MPRKEERKKKKREGEGWNWKMQFELAGMNVKHDSKMGFESNFNPIDKQSRIGTLPHPYGPSRFDIIISNYLTYSRKGLFSDPDNGTQKIKKNF